MKQIQYSRQLLTDFDLLTRDFGLFMSFNLIHADKGLGSECQAKMMEFIQYSVKNNIFVDFFKQPILNYEQENKEKLIKNMAGILDFLFKYISYAEPVLKQCRNDIYNGRFSQLKTHYAGFCGKHIN